MSNLPRIQFPTLEDPITTPAWLVPTSLHESSVRTLLSLLQGEPAPQPEPKVSVAPPPPQPPPAPPRPPSLPPAPDLELPPLSIPDEALHGKLPSAPRITSLLPGARSQPPPPVASAQDDALAESIHAFSGAALELAIARSATLALLEGQLLDLAIEVAQAVIEREVEQDPRLHATLARAALQSLSAGNASEVTLRTSPDGHAAITAAFGSEQIETRGTKVHVVADQTIPGLGCVVDGDSVRVDATVAERLRAVRRAFEEERRRSQESSE